MTLHTRVAIHGEIDGQEAFQLALEAICVAAGEADRIPTAVLRDPCQNENGSTSLGTCIGQGLPGIVDCDFRSGAALHPTDERLEDSDGVWTPACWVELGWDTAYGYTGPNGASCSDLHARAIVIVHRALAARGIGMSWFNEYTCEWHSGIDDLAGLSAAGLEADLWFRNTVMPAIAIELTKGAR
ncbi:hypothetical protein [Nocardia sp. NBC_00511]|uniref:hypothetical protein n=1 Tax=Nocardia sp. NBC_00511 TaxID=2903591 RepID=UPI0030DEC1D7